MANGILYEMILPYKDSQLKPTMRCLDREFKPKNKERKKEKKKGKMYTESPTPSFPTFPKTKKSSPFHRKSLRSCTQCICWSCLVGPANHFCILSKRTLLPALPLAGSSALYLHVPTQIPPPVEHLYPQNLAHSPATTELPIWWLFMQLSKCLRNYHGEVHTNHKRLSIIRSLDASASEAPSIAS